MDQITSGLEQVWAPGCELGEGPVWKSDEAALYWVDIAGKRVCRFFPDSESFEEIPVAVRVTALAPRLAGGWVTATEHGFAFWDGKSPDLDWISHPEQDRTGHRFNDGAVDPMGRFWAGTMNEQDPESCEGSLYRLNLDTSVEKLATGFTISNGMAWSLDRKNLFFTDTLQRTIYLYDYEPDSGRIGNRRVWHQVNGPIEEDGHPDGLTIDEEGFLWSARWGGSRVVRLDPEGQVAGEIRLPASRVTSCTFGGEDLKDLYITTAWEGMNSREREEEPAAGALFRIRLPQGGVEEPVYRG